MRWIVAIAVALMLVGCRAVKSETEARAESVQVRTEYRDRVVRDTVSVRDSIFVLQMGDTVNKWQMDTVVTVVRCYREKQQTRWQSMKIGAFPWLILAVVVLGGLMIMMRR